MSPFKTRLFVGFVAAVAADGAALVASRVGVDAWWLAGLGILGLCAINLPALLPYGVWLVVTRDTIALPTWGVICLGGFACLFWATLAAWPWCGTRRYVPGHCWRCGYNLTGNDSGRCPECNEPTGARLRAAAAAARRH